METFKPGDRVVVINTDLSAPICCTFDPSLHSFRFPDGPLRRDVVYHVAAVILTHDGKQGLKLTGLRVFWGHQEVPWHSCRFRKVDTLRGHVPVKCRRNQPVTRQLCTIHMPDFTK